MKLPRFWKKTLEIKQNCRNLHQQVAAVLLFHGTISLLSKLSFQLIVSGCILANRDGRGTKRIIIITFFYSNAVGFGLRLL